MMLLKEYRTCLMPKFTESNHNVNFLTIDQINMRIINIDQILAMELFYFAFPTSQLIEPILNHKSVSEMFQLVYFPKTERNPESFPYNNKN